MILKWRFARHADVLSGYDTVIFSGNCLDALHHVRSDAQKIYYCHTPPRYLFDFRDAYLSRESPVSYDLSSSGYSIVMPRNIGLISHDLI